MSLKSRIIPAVLIALCSLGFAAFLFRAAERIMPYEGSNGYAALTFDASRSDREIGERLSQISFGGGYISESTQTVFLDNFGEVEAIPLDAWEGRVEDFDPRRDGYAEKLKAFFVRGDKRLFFVPLSAEANKLGARNIQAAFVEALGDIPFSVEFLGYDRPIAFYFALFAAASFLATLASGLPVMTIALAPLLAGFAFIGSPGLALSAIVFIMASVITNPLRALFVARRYGDAKETIWARLTYFFHPVKSITLNIKPMADGSARSRRLQGIKPVGIALPALLLFSLTGMYVYIGALNNVPLGFGGAVIGCSCIVLTLVVWAESNRGGSQNHIRFTPVPIIGSIAKAPLFTRAAVPFTLAAFLALALPDTLGLASYREPSDYLKDQLIQASDYEAHLAFQTSFSFTPLGEERKAEVDNGYLQYQLGDDGLIAGANYAGYLTGTPGLPKARNDSGGAGVIQEKNDGDFERFPQFPLENLVDFLSESEHNEQNSVKTGIETWDMLPIALLILPCILALFNIGQKRYRKKNMLIYSEKWNLFRKRIAA
ncbi:MAG: hypothetical protein LBH85_04300 [Treponema sp.]|jgi:hypothetical protein|nr:hypothetical protein [Treponema sp.]